MAGDQTARARWHGIARSRSDGQRRARLESEKRGHDLSTFSGGIAWCVDCHAETLVRLAASASILWTWSGLAVTSDCPAAAERAAVVREAEEAEARAQLAQQAEAREQIAWEQEASKHQVAPSTSGGEA